MTVSRCAGPAWRKSSYSFEGNCVEVSTDGQTVRVRDSKDPDGRRLSVTPAAWSDFLRLVRSR
ncbi:DUF397 domain-containing protein [Cryptosporangium japonicum]|uniref:DUF397 domain-containing protein n=1 Tax=Cryptosporangium japonicum TaxID=80872 RepID=A0ABP3ETN8_9ACTN